MSEKPVYDISSNRWGREFPEITWTTGVFILLFLPISIIGNGIVLASIIFDPLKIIEISPSSGLIFSLALADLLAGVIAGPLLAYWLIADGTSDSQPFSANIITVTGAFSVGVSLYSLVALSVDRLIAITTPLQYTYRVTKRRIRIVNVFIWCYGIISGALLVVSGASNFIFDIVGVVHFVIVSIFLVVLNITVIRSVHSQALNIKRTVSSENKIALQNVFHREKAVVQAIAVMVAVFEICILPSIILDSITMAMPKVTDIYDLKILLGVYFMSKILLFANSLINPFLYAWRLAKYRKTFQHFLIQLRSYLYISEEQRQVNTSIQSSPTV